MSTYQMSLPPRVGLVALVVATVLWSAQHPIQAKAESSWVLPVSTPAALSRAYLAPLTKFTAGHRGLDYLLNDGDEVFAPSNGQIAYIGSVAGKPVVSILHPTGLRSTLEPVCSTLLLGDFVETGQAIGVVCAHGYKSHCPNICLHWGLKVGENYLNPLALTGALNPSHIVDQARG